MPYSTIYISRCRRAISAVTEEVVVVSNTKKNLEVASNKAKKEDI